MFRVVFIFVYDSPTSEGEISATSLRYPDTVNIGTILTELRQERDKITEAIISLERMALGHRKRRGRPPAWMVAAGQAPAAKKRGRRPGGRNKPKDS
jgi:hypothetical protein